MSARSGGAGYTMKDGKIQFGSPSASAGRSAPGSSPITPAQKMLFMLAAICVGPAVLKQVYDKVTTEQVDISDLNVVTSYDTPAIEMKDNVLRIGFCASCQVNGQFRNAAVNLQRAFPELKIEGGPYTPPVHVQYGIRAVRASQVLIAISGFFGEQLLAAVGRPAPEFMQDTMQNILYHGGAIYGVDLIAQTLKSINAFEITYNGELLHSKLSSGKFPEVDQLVAKLRAIREKEKKQDA